MKIAILYGGKLKSQISEKNAKGIYFDAIKKLPEGDINFCHVDGVGNIYEGKLRSSIHKIFPKLDAIIDTTHEHSERATHHELAYKLGIRLVFANDVDNHEYRKVLSQLDINHPEHFIIKKEEGQSGELTEILHTMWRKVHMPITIKSVKNISSKLLTYSPLEALNHILDIHKKDDDALIDVSPVGKIFTVINIKKYGGQEYYNTPIVEIFENSKNRNLHTSYYPATHLSQRVKDDIYKKSHEVSRHIVDKLVKIDFCIGRKNKLIVTHVHTKINYHEGEVAHSIFKDYGINILDAVI